jgi:hypothetical protein
VLVHLALEFFGGELTNFSQVGAKLLGRRRVDRELQAQLLALSGDFNSTDELIRGDVVLNQLAC